MSYFLVSEGQQLLTIRIIVYDSFSINRSVTMKYMLEWKWYTGEE